MPSNRQLLIIEDEAGAARALEKFFQQKGFAVHAAASGEEGLDSFRARTADAVLLDFKLPGMDGEQVFLKMKEMQPLVPVIIMTAFGEIDRAVRLLKAGAFHYITKPFELDVLLHLVEEATGKSALARENVRLQEKLQGRYSFANFIYRSEIMAETVNLAMRVADSEATVLIGGESGTGKEVLANIIHYASPRKNGPFVKVNLAALPATLIEAELFGHERGAFTGAEKSRAGRFEEADGGTIFLDEIGDLPLETQIKLLRVIQEREIVRLGANKPIAIDIRLISATHRDLAAEVRRHAFREDLFFRINIITIPMPPLRQRREDIPFLAGHFLKKFSDREKKPLRTLDRKALNSLVRHDFPGNVRELENIIERAVILARQEVIGEEDLPLLSGRGGPAVDLAAADLPLPEKVREFERALIRAALEKNRYVGTKAAKALGISESTLRYKMESLGIKPS
ncbi:MAG: sigma-54 dependent transcriptional regulator [Acidobacteria bacterium]|jgi:DNA-binding NtrC family response regulator|nr:sigma-54 dependent transcriptional regulator [Acidobacteriota bacterium]